MRQWELFKVCIFHPVAFLPFGVPKVKRTGNYVGAYSQGKELACRLHQEWHLARPTAKSIKQAALYSQSDGGRHIDKSPLFTKPNGILIFFFKSEKSIAFSEVSYMIGFNIHFDFIEVSLLAGFHVHET